MQSVSGTFFMHRLRLGATHLGGLPALLVLYRDAPRPPVWIGQKFTRRPMVVLEMRGAIDHPSVTVVSFRQHDAKCAWGSTLDAVDPIAGQHAAVGRR